VERYRRHDLEKAAPGIERALFSSDPTIQAFWPNLSQSARLELFDIHRPDLALGYRVAIGAHKSADESDTRGDDESE
jgi:hypothetical protein